MKLAVNSTQKNLIGRQIRELRISHKLTQYQLAAKPVFRRSTRNIPEF